MADHHAALIYTMVLVSASDQDMTDAELHRMGEIVSYLPVFRDFDRTTLASIASECADLLGQEDGLDRIFKRIRGMLPEKLRETAYAIACDVASVDGYVTQEELRLLEMVRHRLEIGRLPAAAIERSARARNATL
jgi:tellurite resistance protein